MGQKHPFNRRTAIVAGLGTMLLPTIASAKITESGTVVSVTSGSTLTLTDGTRVKLASVQVPRRAEPWGREAQEGLAGLLRGRDVRISFGDDPEDRYGRALGQLFTLGPDGREDFWVQEELVRLGLARVYNWPGDKLDLQSLYRTEHEARERGRGLWGHQAYAVRRPDPNPLAQYVDSLQLVEGIITETADVRGRTYLNFGADYRTDFTIAISKTSRRRFEEYNPVDLIGARVRVRGWIELINGPMIWVTHPGRIEILDGLGA